MRSTVPESIEPIQKTFFINFLWKTPSWQRKKERRGERDGQMEGQGDGWSKTEQRLGSFMNIYRLFTCCQWLTESWIKPVGGARVRRERDVIRRDGEEKRGCLVYWYNKLTISLMVHSHTKEVHIWPLLTDVLECWFFERTVCLIMCFFPPRLSSRLSWDWLWPWFCLHWCVWVVFTPACTRFWWVWKRETL